MNLVNAVANNPAGTTFCLSGTYLLTEEIDPKDGQRFIGPALIKGNGATFAFTGNSDDVVIKDLEVTGFNPPVQRAAVDGRDGRGWLIVGNEVHHNATGGVYIGPDGIARDNYIHHNGQIGIKAKYEDGLIEDNEIAFNNWEKAFNYRSEAGGSKFSRTTNLVLRNNYVHDNWGPGLWTDISNIYTRFEGNLIEDNADAGIFHEISCDAVIVGNTVRRNGFDRGDWLWGAGIQIASSNDVEVYDNLLEDNANAIALIQQNRTKQDCGSTVVENAWVHDNTVILGDGETGAVDSYEKKIWSRNNRFERNTYTLGSDEEPFRWDERQYTLSEWRALGHDD